MPENPPKEYLIREIVDSYRKYLDNYLAPFYRRNATTTIVLRNGLVSGLEKILRRELQDPITRDGKIYTADQILEMPINTFIDLHRSSSTRNVARYIRAITYEIESRKKGRIGLSIDPSGVKIRDVVKFPLEEAYRLPNIGERVVQMSSAYFQQNYGITLGAKLG
ncbi:MAG: hypothetical protein AABX34_01060 [Nanoarchaeota archaeon]